MSTHTRPNPNIIGIILMTYGSATTSADVDTFMHHVYPNASRELITEFERRFDVVGSSPLIKITIQQAKALQSQLQSPTESEKYLVEAGMLHSTPFIDDAMKKLKASGASRILGLLLSPQYSPYIMRGYDDSLAKAAAAHGFQPEQVSMIGAWSTEPKFIKLLANRIRKTRDELAIKHGHPTPVIFSTHSLPERVVQKDLSYLDQLVATTNAVVAQSDLKPGEWYNAYQSAGHTPEPWLKPDLTDVVADLKNLGHEAVLIVPVQFLADHLEVLYDLDTAARAQTEDLGIHYYRLPVPGTDPLFIEALADIAHKKIASLA